MSLEFRSACFGYPIRRILSDVSFQVRPGEIVALLGPNGCGKTTLFRTLLGALHLRGGEIFLEGIPLERIPGIQRARSIGYVPQISSPAFPFRSVDVVAMGRRPRLGRFGSPGRKDRAAALDALEAVDAAHLADRPVTELSGGERQRILIARALAQGSTYLLLDEPTSHLDFGHTHQALRILQTLALKGKGILWTTHSPDQALRHAHRVVVLSGGHVASQGPPREILTPALFEETFGIRASVREWTDSDNRTRDFCLVEEDA